MIELELKAVVPDQSIVVERLRRAGARETQSGRMVDLRYDYADGSLTLRDEVIRLRVIADGKGRETATLDWKGPASIDDGYKRREELNTGIEAAHTVRHVLRRLGLVVTRSIERDIRQFELHGTDIRFEHYAQMDDLVEVEGEPDGIERAIQVMGLPRDSFTSESLVAFTQRYTSRTGKAAITGREGDAPA